MSFGLCNAPGTFQTLVNDIFMDHIDDFVLAYLDDILVYSDDWESHIQHLRQVLEILRTNKLYAKRSKCDFLKSSMEFLGHNISNQGINPLNTKVKAIADWPQLQNASEVRSFMGLAQYYRRFVKNFSAISAPLTDLTQLNTPFTWGPPQEQAFTKLKSALISAPTLTGPDPNLDYIMETDASNFAMGAVLYQDKGQGLGVTECSLFSTLPLWQSIFLYWCALMLYSRLARVATHPAARLAKRHQNARGSSRPEKVPQAHCNSDCCQGQ